MLTEREVALLLDELCAELGFCLFPDQVERLAKNPPSDPASFTNDVFRAEDLDPETEHRRLYRQVRDRVALAFIRSEERELERRAGAREEDDTEPVKSRGPVL